MPTAASTLGRAGATPAAAREPCGAPTACPRIVVSIFETRVAAFNVFESFSKGHATLHQGPEFHVFIVTPPAAAAINSGFLARLGPKRQGGKACYY